MDLTIGDGDDGKVLKFDEEDYLCVTEFQLASAISNKVYYQDSSYSLTFGF